MKYKSSKSVENVYGQNSEEPKMGIREKLGDLEIKEFREIESWLFDCSNNR